MKQSASRPFQKRSEIIGKKLMSLRLHRCYTQTELSKTLGIAQTTYAGYETGRHEPSIETLIKLANIYEISLDYLTGRYSNTEDLPERVLDELIYLNSPDRETDDNEAIINLIEKRESKAAQKQLQKGITIEKNKRGTYNRVKTNKAATKKPPQ